MKSGLRRLDSMENITQLTVSDYWNFKLHHHFHLCVLPSRALILFDVYQFHSADMIDWSEISQEHTLWPHSSHCVARVFQYRMREKIYLNDIATESEFGAVIQISQPYVNKTVVSCHKKCKVMPYAWFLDRRSLKFRGIFSTQLNLFAVQCHRIAKEFFQALSESSRISITIN